MENFMNRPSLYEIGIKHYTDKSISHLFSVVYDSYFQHLRDSDIKMLELGIYKGASIKMWEEYFEKAQLHAIDILDCTYLNNDRVKVEILNQENEDELRSLPKDFDIILDDGGHTMLQQQLSLKVLFVDHLKPGGTYILEDLHTSEPKYWGSHGGNKTNNTLRLMHDLKNRFLSRDNTYFINDDDFYAILEKIESIEIVKIKDDSITSRIIKKA